MLFLLLSLLSGGAPPVEPPVWPAYSEIAGYFGDDRQGLSALFFAPLQRSDTGLLFFQTTGVRERHQAGFTAGLGFRRLLHPCLGMGAHAFVDCSRSDGKGTHLEGSFGMSLLTRRFELHGNGYLPWTGRWQGIHFRSSYYGADIRLGYNLEGDRRRLRVFVGYDYFWRKHCPHLAGPTLRLQLERDDLFGYCRSRLTIAGEWHYDAVQRHQGVGWVSLRIPLGKFKRGCCPVLSSICRRMGDPVLRRLAPCVHSCIPPGEEH